MIIGKEEYLEVNKVEWLSGFCLKVQFSDGDEAELDLTEFINSSDNTIFQMINNIQEFQTVNINPVGGIAWKCGVDLAPEFLKKLIRK